MNRVIRNVAATIIIGVAASGCSRTEFFSELFKGETETAQLEEAASPIELLVALGDAAMARGQPENAAMYYQRALEAHPNNAVVRTQLGHALLAQNQYGQAEIAFRQALAVDENQPNAFYGLGKLAIMRDEPEDGVRFFSRAVAAAQGQEGVYRLYNGLGIALDMRGDHEGAQQAYHQGLRLSPTDLTLRNNLGLSLATAGRFDDAIAVMHDVATDPQSTPRHRQNLAMVYAMAGQTEDAANLAFRDLGQTEVDSNLSYYGWLRRVYAEHASTIASDRGPNDDRDVEITVPGRTTGDASTSASDLVAPTDQVAEAITDTRIDSSEGSTDFLLSEEAARQTAAAPSAANGMLFEGSSLWPH